MASERQVPHFFLALMLITIYLLWRTIAPLASDLLLAAVLAAVLWPVQRWMTHRFRGRSTVAAGFIAVMVILVILGPMATLAAIVVRDGADGLQFVANTLRGEAVSDLLRYLPQSAREVVVDAIAAIPKNVEEVMGQVGAHGDQAAAAVTVAVARTSSLVFHAAMTLIALFFFLVRGEEIIGWIDEASPLPIGQTRELLAAVKRVSYAVIVSTVVTSFVQAVAALIGYYIARVPSPLFFASVTFFVAFIPAVGAASVCLVAAGLLVITGHPYMAIFLAAWGVIVVGLVDNVVKPLLIRRGMEIHGGVVFFSLIGGIATFGAIGLLLGPLIVAVFFALLRMYHRDFSPERTRVPTVPGLPGASPLLTGSASPTEATNVPPGA